jgi:DNA repair protein RadC
MIKRRKKIRRVKRKKILKPYPKALEGIRKRRAKRKKVKKPGKLVMCLGSVPKEGVPELKVRFNKSPKRFLGILKQSKDAADFIRKLYTRGSIELQEIFIVLYMNRRNEIIGYYKHSVGGIAGATVDTRIILSVALKSLASSMMIAHNHPSGSAKYSDADRDLTKKIKEAAKLMDVSLLDHIIVTKKDYFSFADEGLI